MPRFVMITNELVNVLRCQLDGAIRRTTDICLYRIRGHIRYSSVRVLLRVGKVAPRHLVGCHEDSL